MLPSSNWMIAPARMYCGPTECWVQPTLYTSAAVRSRPEFSVQARHTFRKRSRGTPQIRSTISGVYRAKWHLRIWNTQRGCSSDGSLASSPTAPSSTGPPEPD